MQATYEQLLDHYQLSESKFIILMLLENETDHTLLPSELATKLGSARATVSKLLVGLQKRGWVEKQHPQDDKRTVAIHLTAAGSSVLTQFLPANFKAVTTIFASFTIQEQQQFKGLLDKNKQGTQQLKVRQLIMNDKKIELLTTYLSLYIDHHTVLADMQNATGKYVVLDVRNAPAQK